MVLMAALLTRVGPLQTFPILIALVTALLSAEGAKYFLARREQVVGGPCGGGTDDQPIQLQDVLEREIDRLDLTRLPRLPYRYCWGASGS
jgi:hypothetical protein